ncbi:MAG TPA: APC family permease [Gemmataceae bacterium]|nr:APC family permease [Gemmataceae bacterium]
MSTPTLHRHFGLLQATALNVTMIVGAGIFVTVPVMLKEFPGPYALLGWLAAAAVMICDSLIWGELGAALPGSGGSYLYLLECYGRSRWGRLMAFLFIWQFLLSGPLEVGSGLIAIAEFSTGLSPVFRSFNENHTWKYLFWESKGLGISFGPSRLVGLAAGCLILYLLRRRISGLGKLTVTMWLGVLFAIAWILVEGAPSFDWHKALGTDGAAGHIPDGFMTKLGSCMRLAMYSYLGYYSVCYIGDEIRNPERTIPQSILISAVLVTILFVSVHLALLGVVGWENVPTDNDSYSLAAEFMRTIYGPTSIAAVLITICLIWTCFGSAFAGVFSYSRIPYGAARYGHFFSAFGQVHPTLEIPHVSLWLVGGMTLVWSLFDLQTVIDALITTRILEQFIAQTIGVMILRRTQPDRPRPFRIWFYPVPCFLALVGWVFMYVTADLLFIGLGLATMFLGIIAFFIWALRTGGWPFGVEAEAIGE